MAGFVKEMDDLFTLMDKVASLATRGLISFEERDAILEACKQEAMKALRKYTEKAFGEPKKQSQPAEK